MTHRYFQKMWTWDRVWEALCPKRILRDTQTSRVITATDKQGYRGGRQNQKCHSSLKPSFNLTTLQQTEVNQTEVPFPIWP